MKFAKSIVATLAACVALAAGAQSPAPARVVPVDQPKAETGKEP